LGVYLKGEDDAPYAEGVAGGSEESRVLGAHLAVGLTYVVVVEKSDQMKQVLVICTI
jgi:hypothetical protein